MVRTEGVPEGQGGGKPAQSCTDKHVDAHGPSMVSTEVEQWSARAIARDADPNLQPECTGRFKSFGSTRVRVTPG